MCKADDQLLDEGCMIPSPNMWLNSSRAMRRRSGARQQLRADTGRPVVSMWWTDYIMLDRMLSSAGLSQCRELREKREEGVRSVPLYMREPIGC